jgi:uncharacterized RDD family membrane protein YckC
VTREAVGAVGAVAEPSQRLVARIIDTLIVGVPIATAATELFERETAQTLVAPITFAVVFFLYEAVQLAVWGRTVGKRLTGLRVVSVTGDRPTVPQALVRAVIYALPPAARPVPILNALAAIFWLAENGLMFEGAYRQALHDRAAGTLVIDVRPRAAAEPGPVDEPLLLDDPASGAATVLFDDPASGAAPELVGDPGVDGERDLAEAPWAGGDPDPEPWVGPEPDSSPGPLTGPWAGDPTSGPRLPAEPASEPGVGAEPGFEPGVGAEPGFEPGVGAEPGFEPGVGAEPDPVDESGVPREPGVADRPGSEQP